MSYWAAVLVLRLTYQCAYISSKNYFFLIEWKINLIKVSYFTSQWALKYLLSEWMSTPIHSLVRPHIFILHKWKQIHVKNFKLKHTVVFQITSKLKLTAFQISHCTEKNHHYLFILGSFWSHLIFLETQHCRSRIVRMFLTYIHTL